MKKFILAISLVLLSVSVASAVPMEKSSEGGIGYTGGDLNACIDGASYCVDEDSGLDSDSGYRFYAAPLALRVGILDTGPAEIGLRFIPLAISGVKHESTFSGEIHEDQIKADIDRMTYTFGLRGAVDAKTKFGSIYGGGGAGIAHTRFKVDVTGFKPSKGPIQDNPHPNFNLYTELFAGYETPKWKGMTLGFEYVRVYMDRYEDVDSGANGNVNPEDSFNLLGRFYF